MSLTKAQKDAHYLSGMIEEFDKTPPFERRNIFNSLFIETFEDTLDPKNYESSWLRVVCNYSDPREKIKPGYQEIKDIYRHELIFLENIRGKKDVPDYVKRSLCQNFMDNLMGARPESYIPPFDVRRKGDLLEMESLGIQANILIEKTSAKTDKNEKFTGQFNQEDLYRIFSSPFFNKDLKLLLLNFAAKGKEDKFIEQIHTPEKLKRKPYELIRKARLAMLLEEFLILADRFDLPKIMKEKDKNTLPYYNSEIIDAIIAKRTWKETPNSITDDLRALFD